MVSRAAALLSLSGGHGFGGGGGREGCSCARGFCCLFGVLPLPLCLVSGLNDALKK